MDEARLRLFHDMTRVQAHYLLRQIRESGRGFAGAAVTQTPWQTSLPEESPTWEEFLGRAELMLTDDGVPEADRVLRFCDDAAPLLAAGRVDRPDLVARHQWFGSFRFNEHPERNAISLHIRNNSAPRSPFEDMDACFRALAELCAEAAKVAFSLRTVTCGTWLNDLPVFLELFPASYARSLKLSHPDTKAGWGWWGQIIDRTGKLHQGRAEAIVRTGRFPHPRKGGECPFEEFRSHVEERAEGRRD